MGGPVAKRRRGPDLDQSVLTRCDVCYLVLLVCTHAALAGLENHTTMFGTLQQSEDFFHWLLAL